MKVKRGEPGRRRRREPAPPPGRSAACARDTQSLSPSAYDGAWRGATTASRSCFRVRGRTGVVEERFKERASSSVLLVYDGGRLEPGVESARRAALERVYAELVQDLGSAPPRKVEVVVYAEKDWRLATQAPDWSGGLYDGRVRVPAQGLTGMTPNLVSVLKHEMTHAFVAARAGGRAPVWLHEGLAQVEEGKTAAPYAAALLDAWRRGGTFTLPALEGSFRRFSAAQAVELRRRSGRRRDAEGDQGLGALGHLLDRLGDGLRRGRDEGDVARRLRPRRVRPRGMAGSPVRARSGRDRGRGARRAAGASGARVRRPRGPGSGGGTSASGTACPCIARVPVPRDATSSHAAASR